MEAFHWSERLNNPLDIGENLEKKTESLNYLERLKHLNEQLALIQAQEHHQEPRKSNPEILNSRVDKKLKHIPNGA